MKKDDKAWNPYVSGALSGIVAIGSVWFVGKYLGASTTFVKTTAMIENLFSAERVASMPYFIKNIPSIDWQWMFVFGIGIGAFIAAIIFKDFKIQKVPKMWEDRFGYFIPARATVAFIGGVIAMIGARMADGCPSGHGLAGVSQLAVSSFIALAMFFIGGLIGISFLYGRRK